MLASARLSARIAMLLAAVAAIAAQDQPTRPFQAEVNYVRVDMYPTANGNSLTDLQQSEVEILEDGVAQKIEQFEHVMIAGSRPQTTRREPSTVGEMRRAASDPRARVVVLFLDPRFVDPFGSIKVRRPLIDALNRLIGEDDLIAVMTPAMAARDLTFTRRTISIEQLLSKYWGEKGWEGIRDPVEAQYEACFGLSTGDGTQSITDQMIARRREVLTLDALENLTDHLRGLREERKAVITISDGWPLYGPSTTLTRPVKNPDGTTKAPPMPPPLGRDPRTGRPGPTDTSTTVISNEGFGSLDRTRCENDRIKLAQLTNENRFIAMMHAANRANVSFYPVDPGRLFSPQPILIGNRALHMMADLTDGLMIRQTDAFDSGLRRIVDDLSSYYLLGYYSNAKADGKFHKITVRIKRPGVQVRARSGYLAATPEEAAKPVTSATSVDTSEARLVTQALASLATFSRELPLRVHAATAWTAAGNALIRAVAEVPRGTAPGDDWSKGGEVEAALLSATGTRVITERAPIAPGAFTVHVALNPPAALEPGEYKLQIRVRGLASLGSTEAIPLTIAAAPAGSGAIFFRRGPSTGNRVVATADARFRRTERIVVETPAGSAGEPSARLLDRSGRALPVPVTTGVRDDPDGSRWRRVEIALAPLAAGDYIIETTSGAERTLTGFRVVP